MGTSGTALFADDSACEVRDEFMDYLRSGCEPVEATRAMLRGHGDAVDDMDEGAVFWLALAATQWKYGCLSDDVRSQALHVIEHDVDMARWGGAARAQRRKVLDALREQLHSPQPKFRRPRRRPHIDIPSHTVASPDDTAHAVAYAFGKSTHPAAPKMQVYISMVSKGERGGGHVLVADCEYDEIELAWIDRDTLRVGYPESAVLSDKPATSYYFGRVINIVYVVRDQ